MFFDRLKFRIVWGSPWSLVSISHFGLFCLFHAVFRRSSRVEMLWMCSNCLAAGLLVQEILCHDETGPFFPNACLG